MSLRELKRGGGYLHQSPAIGEWARYGPGQLARCPMADCTRGLMQAGVGSQIAVRVAVEGVGEEGQPCAFVICGDGRCRARLEIRLYLAPA